MTWITPELESLLAVTAVALDEDGVLIEANAGFLRLIKKATEEAVGARMPHFFLQPDFATLVSAHVGVDGEIYRGLLTMGEYMGETRTLRAQIWRVDQQLRILAEYDIDDIERLTDAVIRLNCDYADTQAKLTRINLELQQHKSKLIVASLTDQLTGVGNRRQLDQALEQEISRAKRTGDRFCAVMADLDHFKRINDTYGHDAGDKVLAAFGNLLRQQTRPTDIVTRFGGEEFIVLMPHTELEHALATTERIRMALAANRTEPLPDPVTGSFGVAKWAMGEEKDMLLRRIDKALYEAKQSGRNCTRIAN